MARAWHHWSGARWASLRIDGIDLALGEETVATPGIPQPNLTKKADIPMVAERDVDRAASMGNLVKDASTHMSTLVRAEIELAKSELTQSVKQGVVGGVFFAIAATVGLFSMFFFWFMIADVLDIWLPRWLASTIVFVLMLLMAGACVFLGIKKIKKVKKPQQTIDSLGQAKDSLAAAVKTHQPAAVPGSRP